MAALFIVASHMGKPQLMKSYHYYLAVDMFFILSGFIIAHAYEKKLLSGAISLWQFCVIRLIRFYPVFLLSLLISVPILFKLKFHRSFSNPMPLFSIASAMVFMPSRLPKTDDLFPMNVVYWTLLFELLVNFMYAGIVRFLNRRILFGIIFLSALLLAYCAMVNGNLNLGYRWNYLSLLGGLARSLFGIFTGIALYPYKPPLKTTGIMAWVAVACLCIVPLMPDNACWNGLIDFAIITLILPACILIASSCEPSRLTPMCLLLGAASYPIYLLHRSLIYAVRILSDGMFDAYAPYTGIGFMVILTLICLAIYRFYEMPFRRWLLTRCIHPAPRVSTPGVAS